MATRFAQVLPNRGVDDNVGPIPEMIVPLKGTNHILLIDGEGLVVKAENPHILDITEVKNFVRKDLPKPRMFQLKGKALPGEGGGLLVLARRGMTVTATLRVFVLDNRIVRLAVRPLQTAPGVFHAKVLPDPVAFVCEMNEIWAPQVNVLIDLVFDGTPKDLRLRKKYWPQSSNEFPNPTCCCEPYADKIDWDTARIQEKNRRQNTRNRSELQRC
jgi:hypothetical protein